MKLRVLTMCHTVDSDYFVGLTWFTVSAASKNLKQPIANAKFEKDSFPVTTGEGLSKIYGFHDEIVLYYFV